MKHYLQIIDGELKDLLFEQGKPLENAVIKALKILSVEVLSPIPSL